MKTTKFSKGNLVRWKIRGKRGKIVSVKLLNGIANYITDFWPKPISEIELELDTYAMHKP